MFVLSRLCRTSVIIAIKLLKAKSKLKNTHYFCPVDLRGVKRVSRLIFAFCAFFFAGCLDMEMVEVHESDEPTQVSVEVLSELISTFDILDDFASTNKVLNKRDDALLPNGVNVKCIDEDFEDGDGVEVELDFGKLGNEPFGVLCKDEKYRAGRINIKLDKPYSEVGAQMRVTFPQHYTFFSGNGGTMTEFDGKIIVNRTEEDKLVLTSNDLNAHYNGVVSNLESDILVVRESDLGEGILDDVILFGGTVSVTNGGVSTILSTQSPLKKIYTRSCAKHIIRGKMDVEITNSSSEMYIDFDPYKDEACDNVIEITVNGKSVITSY